MKTILVPTDFSKAAHNAAEYAIHLASEIKATVLLFHAYHLPLTLPDSPVTEINPAILQFENEEQLRNEAVKLKEKTGVEVKWMAKFGFAVEEILKEEKHCTLLIMGMRGAGKLEEALIGSITTSLLRKTRKPVLVIPEAAKYRDPENVVYACDYDSKTEKHALDALKCFSRTFGSSIQVVSINREREMALQAKRASLVSELSESSLKFYFLEDDDIVGGINKFVVEHHADMVAMIPHRYKLLDRLFHKSISKKMAFHTNVPLLALPDLEKPEAVPSF